MSVSNANNRLVLIAALLLLPLSAAFAESAPTSLLPSPPPAPLSPQAAPFGGSSGPKDFSEGPRGERIQVQDLAAVDPNGIGLIDPAHGGFGSDMWAGSSMQVIQRVLTMLPGALPWHSLDSLEQRLLETTASPPAGKPAGDSLVKLRIERLWAMGNVDAVAGMLKNLPDPALTPELRRLQVDAALLAGDNVAACRQAGALRQQLPGDSYPAKLQIFCQFIDGKANEAGLGVDLLREQKVADPSFFLAADALAGIAPGKLDGFQVSSPVVLAMARAAKLALPETIVSATLPAWAFRSIALMPDLPLETRLLATEKAETLSLIDTEALRQIFEQTTFSDQELAQPLGTAATDKGVKSRALLFRAALQQAQPVAKAEIIAKALTLTSDGPGYFTTARLYAPQIAQIRPSAELAGFAAPAARALFAAGRFDAAMAWVGLARTVAGGGDQAATAAQGLWPLARLAGTETAASIPNGILAGWRKTRVDMPPAASQRRALIAFGLLSAFGDKVPADEWLPLLDGPALVSTPVRPVVWHGLRAATEDLRQAETVLFALVSLGDLSQADPTEIFRAVAALRLIGLETDARALAVEAAIANGV